jgi:hypothetical protein
MNGQDLVAQNPNIIVAVSGEALFATAHNNDSYRERNPGAAIS